MCQYQTQPLKDSRALSIVIAVVFVSLVATGQSIASVKTTGIWYHVRKGDTVWDIARKYKVSHNSILKANRIQSEKRIHIGKKLFIPGAFPEHKYGTWYRVKHGDTLSRIAVNHGIPVSNLVWRNRLKSADQLQANQKIFIPNLHPSSFAPPMRIKLVLTSDYGYRRHPTLKKRMFHYGLDFRARKGTRVYASKSGKIVRSGWRSGYGNYVLIKHVGGFETLYGHLYIIRVKNEQYVKKGQVIALSGNTGRSTGPHLHFEIRKNGKNVNPIHYLNLR